MTPSEDALDFARRSQISRLEERMQTDSQIDEIVPESAREQVLALVEQFGWRIRALDPWSRGWLRCRLDRPSRPLKSATHPLLS